MEMLDKINTKFKYTILVCIILKITYLFTYLLHGAQSFLRSQLVCSQSTNFPHCMEPERSLPHSQVSATYLYSEPAQCSPYPHTLLHDDPFYYYPTIYAWVSPVVLSLRHPYKNPVHASPLLHPSFMPLPFHSSRFYYPHNSGWRVQIIDLIRKFFFTPLLSCPS
jgi:hypothetical protein